MHHRGNMFRICVIGHSLGPTSLPLANLSEVHVDILRYPGATINSLTDRLNIDFWTRQYDGIILCIGGNELEDAYAAGSDDLTQVTQGEVLASLSSARCWQIKLLERINFISSMSNVQSTVVKKKFGRLPEIKLVTFKGNFDERETFWSSFRTNVDVRDDLEKATKFIYLVQSLEGEP